MNDQERSYNGTDFTVVGAGAAHPGETLTARIGERAPEFEASDLDGNAVRLRDFAGSRHVVLMTGAVTSPMCAFEVPEFNRLEEKFSSRGVAFRLLYTRESHPAEHYGAHESMAHKRASALALKRLEEVRFPIVVDHLDGRIHRAYGAWPNALFVIHKDGRLVFRSNMASHSELEEFLDALFAAESGAAAGKVFHWQYSERLLPHEADQATHRRVYERAGPRAFENYWAKRPEKRGRWP